jgi:hypothetical protein
MQTPGNCPARTRVRGTTLLACVDSRSCVLKFKVVKVSKGYQRRQVWMFHLPSNLESLDPFWDSAPTTPKGLGQDTSFFYPSLSLPSSMHVSDTVQFTLVTLV